MPHLSRPEVRTASSDDAPEISHLLGMLCPGRAVSFHPGTVRQAVRSFVASTDGTVVGFAAAACVNYGYSSYSMIDALIVAPAHRGLGIGRSLLHACLEWSEEQNIEVVFVSAASDNAVPFYAKHGFKPCTGPWLFYSPGGGELR